MKGHNPIVDFKYIEKQTDNRCHNKKLIKQHEAAPKPPNSHKASLAFIREACQLLKDFNHKLKASFCMEPKALQAYASSAL